MAFEHSGHLDMVQTYSDLGRSKDGGGYWISPKAPGGSAANGG